MKSMLYLCFIVAVKATNLSSTLTEKTTIVSGLDKIAHRKSFLNEIINIFGAFKNDMSNNTSINMRSKNELTYSQLLYSFLNKTYVCGSVQSKEIAPDLLATVEAVSQLPFMDYIITDTVKYNTVTTVKKCASVTKLKKKSKKKKNITRTKKLDTFFTGAFDDSIATKDDKKIITIETDKLKNLKSNNAVIDQFRTILDGVIDEIDAKYSEKGDSKLVKVIFEIGDNLKKELDKNSHIQEEPKSKHENDDGRLTINDVLFRTNTAMKKIEDSSDRDHRRRMETESDSGDGEANEDASDIVLNNNMEIFVRMNKPFD